MISNETEIRYSDVFQNAPGTVLGYRENGQPIYNIGGGSIDVTDDDATDNDDDNSDDTDDEPSDDWTPPSRDEWQKVLDAKKKADSEAAQRKRWLRDNGFDPKTGQPISKPSVDLGDEDDDDTDVIPSTKKKDDDADLEAQLRASRDKLEKTFQRQLERETQKAETRGRTTAYNLIVEVPSALEEAGWNGKNLPRMIKLLDLDSVEIDDDGVDAEALEKQVAELKKDFPEFFKRSRMKDAAKDIADTGAVGGGKKQAPASEEDLDWKARMRLQLQQPNR